MSKTKDLGARELERREKWSERTCCARCGQPVISGGKYTWAKTKGGRFVFLCADCAKKEGVLK